MSLKKKAVSVNKQKYGEKHMFRAAILLVVLFGVVILICLWGTRVIKKDHYTHTTKGDFYQYIGDNRIDYSGSIAIERLEEENRLMLTCGEDIQDIDGTPLYFDNQEKLYTLEECIYVNPDSYAPGFVNAYAEVFLKGNVPWAKIDNKNIVLNGGFLYNGTDLYIFLEPVTILYGEKSMELSALSYASVTYGNDIILYDFQDHEYVQEKIEKEEEAFATFSDGRKIDMNADILYDAKGNWQLLVTTPALSKPLK